MLVTPLLENLSTPPTLYTLFSVGTLNSPLALVMRTLQMCGNVAAPLTTLVFSSEDELFPQDFCPMATILEYGKSSPTIFYIMAFFIIPGCSLI